MAVANQEAMPPRTGNIATANPGCPNWEGAKEVEDTPNKWAPSEEGREKDDASKNNVVSVEELQICDELEADKEDLE
uniref:Uncharacterized protein n=1 Tax=Oryza glaberrima TaxID=4538 RepID=I1PDJ6_ORYGL